jgi:hypothetical protein
MPAYVDVWLQQTYLPLVSVIAAGQLQKKFSRQLIVFLRLSQLVQLRTTKLYVESTKIMESL